MISASFLSSDNIPSTLTKLNETDVDFIHVDVMDGKYVSNKTLPFREIKHIYKFTNKRLDVHLMVNNPSKYIKDYVPEDDPSTEPSANIGSAIRLAFQMLR